MIKIYLARLIPKSMEGCCGPLQPGEHHPGGNGSTGKHLGGIDANYEVVTTDSQAHNFTAHGLAGPDHHDFIIAIGGDGKLQSCIGPMASIVIPSQIKGI